MGTDRRSDEIELEEIDTLLETADSGDPTALTQAVALYEAELASAHEAEKRNRYQDISRAYQKRFITVLDDATQTNGWEFLTELLDAYHPETTDEFPHVTTILQNVTGRSLIRTRLLDGVEAIPLDALRFFSSILNQLDGEGYDFIVEGMHPYGFGIGHPNHAVADDIHDHASTDIFVVNPMLEYAFYADQQLAMDLVERIVRDSSIQQTIRQPRGSVSETRYLLDAPAGAVSDFTPTTPRYWEWQAERDYEFKLEDRVEQRLRKLVAENDLDDNLSSDWEIADLTL